MMKLEKEVKRKTEDVKINIINKSMTRMIKKLTIGVDQTMIWTILGKKMTRMKMKLIENAWRSRLLDRKRRRRRKRKLKD